MEDDDVTVTEKYVLFWKGWPSQWWPSNFVDGQGQSYHCAEQYMMAEKARLFGDDDIHAKIMRSQSPRGIKALGRKIKNFNERTWVAHRSNIVYAGSFYKFSQNPQLKEKLLGTGDRKLVEASPLDKIWGIGLDTQAALSTRETQWPGENLLGKALELARKHIADGYTTPQSQQQ
eukprot:TRINITY_DN1339_c0_g1_i1.p1 TRINITY_DN1339_c0_g1~~TRINITY_DN1339_c0_g1_i1.p1  ORF type:complete len:175 (+),score=40.11 TRINITY_DN1339_c0_g1_i1:35-559(+)